MKTYIFIYILSIFLMIPSCITKKTEIQTDKDTVDYQEPIEINYTDLISIYGKDSIDDWGKGIISNKDYNSGEILNFPDTSIEVYDNPVGNVIGKIYRVPNLRYDLLFDDFKNMTVKKINRKDYREVTYEGQNIKYFREDKGFINCLIHSIDNGVWIKIEDIERLNFIPMVWRDFLIKSHHKMHPPYKTSIPLFDSTGYYIDSLNYGEFELLLVNKKINNLIKVEIFNPGPCNNGDGKKAGDAWIELIDKNGHPTVFYNARGC